MNRYTTRLRRLRLESHAVRMILDSSTQAGLGSTRRAPYSTPPMPPRTVISGLLLPSASGRVVPRNSAGLYSRHPFDSIQSVAWDNLNIPSTSRDLRDLHRPPTGRPAILHTRTTLARDLRYTEREHYCTYLPPSARLKRCGNGGNNSNGTGLTERQPILVSPLTLTVSFSTIVFPSPNPSVFFRHRDNSPHR